MQRLSLLSALRVAVSLPALVACLTATASAQDPTGAHWIWGSWAEDMNRPEGEATFFRHAFTLPAAAEGKLHVSCDNHCWVWLNGEFIGQSSTWEQALPVDLGAGLLREGKNVIAVEGVNGGGPAALMLFVDVQGPEPVRVQTGPDWKTSAEEPEGWADPDFDDSTWLPAKDLGPWGTAPWTGVAWRDMRNFAPLPGFQVEPAARDLGTLVALTGKGPGEVFASVENGDVLLLRDRSGDGRFDEVDVWTDQVTGCHGLLWADERLYAVGKGPDGMGLYRLDEQHGSPVLLGRLNGSGEHGPHAVREGPDGLLYVMIGNHTDLGEEASPSSPFQITYEGHLLPRYLDPRGHANNIRAPGGVLLRVDKDGREWEVVCGGFRNTYDFDFHPSGDMFGFDSDMEWDVALPWYRPLYLFHLVPGGEYGWRTGSGKWNTYFPDAVPPVAEAGRGSPTGVACYDGHQFPARYHGSILGADWSSGEILAFHLRPDGTTWKGDVDVLLRGRPLNITDLIVDHDGSVLFTLGGRNSRGGLFRLSYTGEEAPAPKDLAVEGSRLLDTANQSDAALVEALSDSDRMTRFLAGRELERRSKRDDLREALMELDPRAQVEAAVALARLGTREFDRDEWLTALLVMSDVLKSAEGELRLDALRALSLLLMLSDEDAETVSGYVGRTLAASFPSGDRLADRETARLLARAEPKGTVDLLLGRLLAEPSRLEQIHLAYCLRCVERGWTRDTRVQFMRWLEETERWSGGFSFVGYLEDMREEFAGRLEPDELAAVEAASETTELATPVRAIERRGVALKDFDQTLTLLQRTLRHPRRSAAEGALVFRDLCSRCHQHGTLGSGVGPDLTTVGARYTVADLLRSVLDPARTISDQYQSVNVFLTNGDVQSGMPVREDAHSLALLQATGDVIEVDVDRIDERRVSSVSIMPQDLLTPLTYEEVADLVYFLMGEPLAEMPAESAWHRLFDGKGLAGWQGDEALWSVEHGELVGLARGLDQNRFLVSDREYADFVLEFDVKLRSGNSGLQFRSTVTEDGGMAGYQADVGESYWGSLYEERGRGQLATIAREIWPALLQREDWNHFVVTARGSRLEIEFNGTTTVSIDDDQAAAGRFGFQVHAGDETHVRLRNIRVRED